MEAEANVFKILSDPTRLRMAVLFALEGEICVCRLAQALQAPDSRISRHLGIMRAAGLVQARRKGTWIYYRLSSARNGLERCLWQCLRKQFAQHPEAQADRQRLSMVSC
jgi:ArsR family transcriptional regulator